MKSVILYEPHIHAPVCGEIVDANFAEHEAAIAELKERMSHPCRDHAAVIELEQRVQAFEEVGKPNKPVDFATMYVPEDRVKERIADARCEERQRAADMVLDHYGDSVAKKHFESLAQFILDGPDAETQEHRPTATEAILGVQDHLRYTQADLDAAVEKDRERVDAWIRKTLEPGFMVWAEAKNGLLRHILNGDEVPE